MRHFDVSSSAVIERTGSKSLIHADQRQPLFGGHPSDLNRFTLQGALRELKKCASRVRTLFALSNPWKAQRKLMAGTA